MTTIISRLRSILHQLHPRQTSTMPFVVHNNNAACCSIPPVQHEYTPKGSFVPYGNFKKVYVTGPDNASTDTAITCAYDIFGFFPQTAQGADIIAQALNVKVYMPDFFEPTEPMSLSKYPPKTEQDKADIQAFFAGPANVTENTKKALAFGEVLRKSGYNRVGFYGFCWGGKVAICVGGHPNIFDSVAMIHPAMLSVGDAEKLNVPIAMYVSKDEPIEEYKKILEIVSNKSFASKCDNKLYPNMFHGWAAARGNLKDEENRKEYDDVYRRLVVFFRSTLVIPECQS